MSKLNAAAGKRTPSSSKEVHAGKLSAGIVAKIRAKANGMLGK